MSCACEQDFLGKNLSNAGELVAAFYLTLTSGNSLTQWSDQWLDCRAWQDLFLLNNLFLAIGGRGLAWVHSAFPLIVLILWVALTASARSTPPSPVCGTCWS